MRLLTGLDPFDAPRENARAIARGERAKIVAEEPWNWHPEWCGCVPCVYVKDKERRQQDGDEASGNR